MARAGSKPYWIAYKSWDGYYEIAKVRNSDEERDYGNVIARSYKKSVVNKAANSASERAERGFNPRSRKRNAKRFKTSYGYAGSSPKSKKRPLSGGTLPRKKKPSTKSNPGAKLKAKIQQMKPGSWYPTTLSGARVKVQRKGNSLVIRPASKKRSR